MSAAKFARVKESLWRPKFLRGYYNGREWEMQTGLFSGRLKMVGLSDMIDGLGRQGFVR